MKRLQPVAVLSSALVATMLWWGGATETRPAPHPTAAQIDAAVQHARTAAGLDQPEAVKSEQRR